VIALTGPLGSGKTQLVKGIAAGAGASDSSRVSSPTFVIINEYPPAGEGLYIYHIDAYRIESAGEFEMLGFDELCYPESVVIIEWADKVRQSISRIRTVDIEMAHRDETSRSIAMKDLPEHLADLFV
jgi:tRNA threonylcarbamoyladenosine biosynthesis protein TsaE